MQNIFKEHHAESIVDSAAAADSIFRDYSGRPFFKSKNFVPIDESNFPSTGLNFKRFRLSGVKPENLKITVDKFKKIVIEGEQVIENDNNGVKSTRKSSVNYKFQLPDGVDVDTLESVAENDVLRVEWQMPEKEKEEAKKIPIKII